MEIRIFIPILQNDKTGETDMHKKITRLLNRIFDRLEKFWESERTHMGVGYILILTFIGSLLAIELKRQGFLPSFLNPFVSTNHFIAVGFVFNLLLIVEVISLVFNLVHSVSEAVGKQFEILSLILLRSSFKEFVYFGEPITWSQLNEPLRHIFSDAGGALLVFILLGFYYKLQKHRQITKDTEDQNSFISSKKILALILLIVFTITGINSFWQTIQQTPGTDFFAMFYTILVFADILIVLISLRYNYRYCTLFRNSGFAVTTVVIRLALTAPPYVNVALGIGAAVFAIGLTVAYNLMLPEGQDNEFPGLKAG